MMYIRYENTFIITSLFQYWLLFQYIGYYTSMKRIYKYIGASLTYESILTCISNVKLKWTFVNLKIVLFVLVMVRATFLGATQ